MDREKLLASMNFVLKAIPTATHISELASFWLNNTEISGSDGSLMAKRILDEPLGFSCLVPAVPLVKLLSGMSEDDVDLEINEDKLIVKGDKVRGRFSIDTQSDILSELDWSFNFTDFPKDLLDGFRLAKFASSRRTNDVLAGIFLEGKTIIGTDGRRALIFKATKPLSEVPIIVPYPLVSLVCDLGEEITGWAGTEKLVAFKIGDKGILAGQLVPGHYPYKTIDDLAKQCSKVKSSVEFPTSLIPSLRRHIGQQIGEPRVKVTMKPEVVELYSSDGMSYELEDAVPLIGYEGDPFSFSMNPQLMIDILGLSNTMKFSPDLHFVAFSDEKFLYILALVG